MLERTKKPHTNIAITFVGPAEMQARAVELMRGIGFKDTDGVPWREAFPEFASNEKGTILKGARLKEELTQKQLSEKTGISQRHLSEVETGKRQIGRKWAELLAKALNVPDYRIFL
jgi:ribosome-binding protein aMBF1 (putative translation factor)